MPISGTTCAATAWASTPCLPFIETLHTAAVRNVALVDFAGGLSRWLPNFYTRHTTTKRKHYADQLAKGRYTLQRLALADYLDDVHKKQVIDAADEAGSDSEFDLVPGDGKSSVLDDTITTVQSIEQPRAGQEQPLDDGIFGPFDDITASPCDSPFTSITMRSERLARGGGSEPLASTPRQSQHGDFTPSIMSRANTSRTLSGRAGKLTPLQPRLEHATLRGRIRGTLWKKALEALKTVLNEHNVVALVVKNAELKL